MNRRLDPRARLAAESIQAQRKIFGRGPLVPSWLSAALPPRSVRRGWRDYAAVYILCDILAAHRLIDGQVFFRGPLYQVNREQWAEQIPTTLKEVSLTLTWLADTLGVIGRDQRIRMEDGQPRGSQTFVWPIVARIREFCDFYEEHGRAMPLKGVAADPESDTLQTGDGLEGNSTPAFEASSSPASGQPQPESVGHSSLISASTPTTAGGSGESPDRTDTPKSSQAVRTGRRLAAGGGGGASERSRASASADPEADSASPVSIPVEIKNSGEVVWTHPAPPCWSPTTPPKGIDITTDDDKEAWRKATRFRALWQEAIVRSGTLSSCRFTFADIKQAYTYFQDHPEVGGWLPLAIAIHAWSLAEDTPKVQTKRRRVHHILFSRDPGRFLRSMDSGKIEAEVGLFAHVNAWHTLRWYFTTSELVYWGWRKDKVPIRAASPENLWEYDPDAPSYYRQRQRQPPPEFDEPHGRGECKTTAS